MGRLVNINVANLLNGVSQQASQMRRDTQAEEQINAVSSLVDGLYKRPPTVNVAKILNIGEVGDTVRGFVIDRDESEKYYVAISNIEGGTSVADEPVLKIVNLVDPDATITIKNADGDAITDTDLQYLLCNEPYRDLRESVVEDFVFITNKTKEVKYTSSTSSDPNPSSLVFIKNVADGAKYYVDLWTSASGSGTPDYTGTFTATDTSVQNDVAVGLISSLTSEGATTYFTLTHNNGSLMRVRKTNDSDFRIEIRTTLADSGYAFKDVVSSFNILPYEGYVGFKIKIAPDARENTVGYYVEFKPANDSATGFATGQWEETIAGGLNYVLDEDTMPHALINTGVNEFTFRPMTWEDRLVGDDDTNITPSFVGNYINNVFTWKGRLGILSGSNVSLSGVRKYFNFFRTSVLNLLDDDPIDVGLSVNEVMDLNYFISNFNQTILFSDKAQFSLGPNNDIVTPSTIETSTLSKFSNYKNCEPCGLGQSVFFASSNGDYSLVKEMYLVQTGVAQNNNVTEQCPRYIEGEVENMVAIGASNALVIKSSDANVLYLYKFHDTGSTRVQSAWSKFVFNDNVEILDISAIDHKLYMLVKHADGIYIEYISLETDIQDVLLDRLIDNDACTSVTYSEANDLTTVVLPYQLDTGATVSIVNKTTKEIIDCEVASSTTLEIDGDYSAVDFWVGVDYEMQYTMSNVKFKTQTDSGSTVQRYTGRLQLRYLNISLNGVGPVIVDIEPFNRNKFTYDYDSTPFVSGTGYSVIDEDYIDRVLTMRVPIFCNAHELKVTIKNDEPFISKVIGVNYEATLHIKGSSL